MAARRVRETDINDLCPASDGSKFGLLVRSPVPTSLVARMNLVHVADAIPSLRLSPLLLPFSVRYRLVSQVFQSYLASHRASERARGPL